MRVGKRGFFTKRGESREDDDLQSRAREEKRKKVGHGYPQKEEEEKRKGIAGKLLTEERSSQRINVPKFHLEKPLIIEKRSPAGAKSYLSGEDYRHFQGSKSNYRRSSP